jgi:hypothetical protein
MCIIIVIPLCHHPKIHGKFTGRPAILGDKKQCIDSIAGSCIFLFRSREDEDAKWPYNILQPIKPTGVDL